jgi:predicted nucleotidyltransferase
MISKKLLDSQALKLFKDFKKENKNIFDIVIYGSVVRNKIRVNDIDVAIIFSGLESVNDKLSLAQEMKSKLKDVMKYDLDVKGVDMGDFLDGSFLARNSILAEGFSVLRKKFLHEIFGFKNYYVFSYSLTNLSNSRKVMFQYALQGRRGEKGMMEITGSSSLGKGVIRVPLGYSEEFKDFFEKNKIKYKVNKILRY